MRRRTFTTAIAAAAMAVVFRPTPSWAEPRAFVRGSWQALQSAHRGHSIIVHFWGLTCGPCLTELPKWGEFHHTYPRAKLVMVAADAVPQMPDALNETLAKAGLEGVESWWFQDRFIERLFREVDQDWQGELPFTVLLASDGPATTHLGAIADFTILGNWARELSKQPP